MSQLICARQGIAAGSPFATHELCLHLGSALLQLHKAHRSVHMTVHVDDLSLTARASQLHEGCDTLDTAISDVLGLVRKGRSMTIADDKTVVLAASEHHTRRLQDLAKLWNGTIAAHTRRLGIDHRLSGRIAKKARLKKLLLLRSR
jgi:hypothetical protein